MQTPPFRPLSSSSLLGLREPGASAGRLRADPAPGDDDADDTLATAGRKRLGSMDGHLHCSVIGTCLSTGELRKVMRRFIVVDGASDLDVHHEAVRLATERPDVAHALNKVLDRRHESAVQRYGRVKDAETLARLWQESLQAGEVPGAYWALLTHRRTTVELRQQVFGDVHMLSHLVGAANRADVRRLVAIEEENAALHERNGRLQDKLDAVSAERDQARADQTDLAGRLASLEKEAGRSGDALEREQEAAMLRALTANLTSAVALQTQRREAAEFRAQSLATEAGRLTEEIRHLRDKMRELGGELGAAEDELRRQFGSRDPAAATAASPLAGRRLLYVGGRPSSHAAIRDYVLGHGGEYQRHDGGLEVRKGLLASSLAWADVVVFPVDCIDHDSALALKRACQRQGRPFRPLRSASVTSFVAALPGLFAAPEAAEAASPPADASAPSPAGASPPRDASALRGAAALREGAAASDDSAAPARPAPQTMPNR